VTSVANLDILTAALLERCTDDILKQLTIKPMPEKTVNTAFRYTQTAVKVNAE
jgi:hypothetical protein